MSHLLTSNIGFIALYLLSLIAIGIYGKTQRQGQSLSDFYLGGRDFGFILLFLTFYATQYSGNTIIGFSGKAYREGWITLSTVVFMVSVIGGLLLYAPKLYRLSQQKKYITIGDYIEDRYQHQWLTYLVILVCLFVLGNYVLSNLKAMGYIVETLSNGSISAAWGIIGLAAIIFIYETLGGMRSVVLTDALQGVLLLITIQIIFFVVVYHYGFTPDNTGAIVQQANTEMPSTTDKIKWMSTILLIFFSISIYPHAIQRIFMAKSEKVLKKSFKLMAIMPFFTTLPVVLIAIIATHALPDLDKAGSENVMILLLNQLSHIDVLHWVVLLFFSAALAAIMSTIDSSNMAMHSMLVKNVYLKIKPNSTDKNIAFFGKLFSLTLIGLLSYLAINIDSSIWIILKIKLEVLAQLFPAIVLGVWFRQVQAKAVFAGILIGLAVMLYLLLFATVAKPLNIHAGLWGLLANFATIALIQAYPIIGAKNAKCQP